jgi:hypothetical protein
MTREEKLETIVKLFAKGMFYKNWEWKSPNDRVISMLMQDIGMYPISNKEELVSKTHVDDYLYQEAIKLVPRK